MAKDAEIKNLNESKDSLDKEIGKLKEKVKVIEDAGKSSGKSDKEKDKIIAVSLICIWCTYNEILENVVFSVVSPV